LKNQDYWYKNRVVGVKKTIKYTTIIEYRISYLIEIKWQSFIAANAPQL